jgi:hypothetical protein
MKSAALGRQSFLQGFTQAGLFGWAKMPGGAERVFEEAADLEQSEFAELLLPIARLAETTPKADTDDLSEFAPSLAKRDFSESLVVVPDADGKLLTVKLGKLAPGEAGVTFDALRAALDAYGK